MAAVAKGRLRTPCWTPCQGILLPPAQERRPSSVTRSPCLGCGPPHREGHLGPSQVLTHSVGIRTWLAGSDPVGASFLPDISKHLLRGLSSHVLCTDWI